MAQGRDLGQHAEPCKRSATTATATRCWRSSSRPVRRATPASGPAFTAASSSRRRRTRRFRSSSARSPNARRRGPRAPTRRSCSTTRRGRGAKVQEEAEEVVARRPRGVRRARRRGGRRRPLPPGRAAPRPRPDARRRRAGARWPSPAALTRRRRAHPVAAETRGAGRRLQPDPAPGDVHRRLPDAGVGVPQAARRRAVRSCSSRPTRAASAATRSSASARARCCAGRSATAATRTRSRPPSSAALAAAPLRDLPPFAGGAVGLFAYDLVRTVEPLGEPNPDPLGAARPGADADRRAGRLRPPQAHGHGDRQRLRATTTSTPPTRERCDDDRRGALAAGTARSRARRGRPPAIGRSRRFAART